MMNQSDPIDQAWKLLQQAKKREPSPFFVRNVLREVRGLEQEAPGLSGLRRRLRFFFARPTLLIGATACAGFALLLMPLLDREPAPSGNTLTLAYSENQSEIFDPASEMASIEYLGQLMAVADPGQLDDASLAELFF